MVPMRDGTQLRRISISRNERLAVGEKFPTILERTPYNKQDKFDTSVGNFFASRGYARDSGHSETLSPRDLHMLTDDGKDDQTHALDRETVLVEQLIGYW